MTDTTEALLLFRASLEAAAPGCVKYKPSAEQRAASVIAEALAAKDAQIAESERDNERLRSDLLENCVADRGCEKCGSPLFDGDHTFTDPDGNSGCWYAFLAPEKAGQVPCYQYRQALKEKNDG